MNEQQQGKDAEVAPRNDVGQPTEDELKPANSNPWYILATLHGEQTGTDIDEELHRRNRQSWNRWIVAALDDVARQNLVNSHRVDPTDMGRISAQERRDWEELARPRLKHLGLRLPDPGSPTDPAVVELISYQLNAHLIVGGFVFPGDVRLYASRFCGRVDLRQAIFCGGVLCDGTTFEKEVNFFGVKFGGAASFILTRFCGDATFDHVSFPGKAWFDKAQFASYAAFSEVTFRDAAVFSNAVFRAEAIFYQTLFRKSAEFAGADFAKNAVFSGTTFRNTAGFDHAVFRNHSSFAEVVFRNVAFFRAVTFQDFASFDRSEFRASAYFQGAAFRDIAAFSDVHFRRAAMFDNVSFHHQATFNNTAFCGTTSFDKVRFIRSPDFRDARLPFSTTWHNVEWPQSSRDPRTAREAVEHYAALRHIMDTAKRHDAELDFFVRELGSRRYSGIASIHRLVISTYLTLADGGRSFGRPLSAWLVGIGIAFILHAPTDRGYIALPKLEATELLTGIIGNALVVGSYALDRRKLDRLTALLGAEMPVWLQVADLLHSGFSALCLFLMALAIRNWLRLR